MSDQHKTNRICSLNDDLRRKHAGGQVVTTSGIQALGPEIVARIFAAIANFDGFNGDNDPYHEHDCATLSVDGSRIMFKLDYYDHSMQYASMDPSDPAKTRRVMTVMLAEEY